MLVVVQQRSSELMSFQIAADETVAYQQSVSQSLTMDGVSSVSLEGTNFIMVGFGLRGANCSRVDVSNFQASGTLVG